MESEKHYSDLNKFLEDIVGAKYLITKDSEKQAYCKGYRFGSGERSLLYDQKIYYKCGTCLKYV